MNVDHWQNIYTSKNDNQVSWTQHFPQIAIDNITALGLPLTANIIDVGGGTGNFVDALLDLGYINVTVLDISEAALAKSKARLGLRAAMVNWIIADITSFNSDNTYDFWYDRAVFHFLTEEEDILSYVERINKFVSTGGNFLLGTFSKNGPLKCSGLEIRQYSAEELQETFSPTFELTQSFKHIHTTPFDTTQEFQFCKFIKI
jgi:ubiquinone/menaquinone biosynthesis C-methylase UbiE